MELAGYDLTAVDVAQKMGISRQAVSRLARLEVLDSKMISRTRVFSSKSVEQLLADPAYQRRSRKR